MLLVNSDFRNISAGISHSIVPKANGQRNSFVLKIVSDHHHKSVFAPTDAPIFPVENKRLSCEKVLKNEASDLAVGACLYQIEDGEKRPIAYRSRKLSGPEERYEVHDQELLAIVGALQE